MSHHHRVRPGENVDQIAALYGWFPQTLWDHEENRALRERRRNRNVLMPGDVLFIPDKRQKELPVECGVVNRFRRKGVPWKLRLRLREFLGPRKQLPYKLVIEGRELKGTTNDEGMIEHWVPTTATRARLFIGGEEYELLLSQLLPSSTPEGARARLISLGFMEAGEPEDALPHAIARFQERFELTVNGELDGPTCERLESEHGC